MRHILRAAILPGNQFLTSTISICHKHAAGKASGLPPSTDPYSYGAASLGCFKSHTSKPTGALHGVYGCAGAGL